MEFGILGPLEVGGEPFRGGSKPRALLVALLTARGSPVSSERLIDAVWGERPPATAAHALQVYVSELRKQGAAVERAGDGYRLRTDRLDAAEFEELMVTASAHRLSGRHEQALTLTRPRARPLARSGSRRNRYRRRRARTARRAARHGA